MNIRRLAVLLMATTAVTAVACGTDQSGAAPESGGDVAALITATQAKSKVDSGTAVMVDTRSVQSYVAVHATGAVSAPIEEIEVNPSGAITGISKDQELILYCT